MPAPFIGKTLRVYNSEQGFGGVVTYEAFNSIAIAECTERFDGTEWVPAFGGFSCSVDLESEGWTFEEM